MHSLFNILFLTKRYIHFLLCLFMTFFSADDEHRLFVSFLETPYEVSLVLDEQAVKLFPEGFITVYEKPWRAIQFSLGASPRTHNTINQC